MAQREPGAGATRPGSGQRWRRRRVLALAPGLTLLLASRPARAHAVLEHSMPAANGQVPAGAVAIRLQYNSRVDAGRSRLTLVRPDKSETVLPIDKSGAANALTATVTLAPGAYAVRWLAVAVDGHIAHGAVPFTVRAR